MELSYLYTSKDFLWLCGMFTVILWVKKAQSGGIKRYSFNRIYTPPNNKMADLMSRPISPSFNTRFLNRLKHEEVVSAINEKVNTNIECIKTI